MNKSNIFLATLVTALFLSSCGNESQQQAADKPTVKVTTEIVKKTSQFVEHHFSGKVKADDKTVLSTRIIGQVTSVLVKEGDKVRKGQLLLTIKSNDLIAKKNTTKAAVKAAKLNKENRGKNYQRLQRLHQKGSVTDKDLEDMAVAKEAAVAEYNEAKHYLAEVEEYLSYANLRAPISGFVSAKMLNVGDMAKPGFPLMIIESLDELKIQLNVPEFEIGKFELGDIVSINVDVAKLKEAKGKVDRIIPSSSSGQFRVVVGVDEPSALLKSGMFARVDLLKEKEDKLLINQEVIVKKGQLRGVYTINQQGEAMLRWLRLGKTYGNQVEVLSGLSEGEELIVSASSKLTDGILVISSK